MSTIMNIALLVLAVVLLVEWRRQSWRANRCKALADRRKAEAETHSNDHAIAEDALRRIGEIAGREERTRMFAALTRCFFGVLAILCVALAVYINLPGWAWGGQS
jgi:hypothetical protein